MKEFEKNNASELLTQLLDGELETANEPILFSAMASDKDLFDELKQHLAIRDAIRKDTEAFTPPPDTVNAVFSSLGYRAPGISPLPSVLPAKSVLWGKYLRRTVPFALLLVGIVGTYSIFNSASDVNPSNLKPVSKNKVASVNTVKANVPEIVSLEKNKINKTAVVVKKTITPKQTKSREIQSDGILTNHPDKNTVEIAAKEETQKPELQKTMEMVSFSKAEFRNSEPLKHSSALSNNTTINNAVFIAPLKLSGSDNTKLYIKSNSNFNSDPLLFNWAVGLSFLNNGNFKIGLEVGQQTYNVKMTDANDLIHEKSRSVFWYGAAFRYEAEELISNYLSPFAQLSIGSGDFGSYLYRFSCGMEIIPFGDNLGFNIGLENSTLHYTIEGNPYDASSLGLIMGLSWKF